MNLQTIATLILLMPLAGFLINGLLGKQLSKSLIGYIGSGVIFISFALTAYLFLGIIRHTIEPFNVHLFNLFSLFDFTVNADLQIDQLSLMMMMIITGVGFLIHVYSTGYMHDDAGFYRFFAYLNLFVFSMLNLVMGANYVLMFFGWEGVGLCSYLLIGFWFKNQEYNDAAKKAFVMNRIGDLGFLLGIFLLYQNIGSFDYRTIFASPELSLIPTSTITILTLLLFIGAIGKSAQLPLYTWLPDAMAGPTPVSALIHAATMVTAGIYMIVRSHVLFSLAPATMEVITVIGLSTALFAGTIALFQNDIKKVLAYSTVSQLGFMFMAVGVGAYTSGMFHLMTHAFFKALLFLGAGSVIHAMSGEQNMNRMGGLRSKIPLTFWTVTIGVLAISGFPFTSGFVSKDEILLAVYNHNKFYFALAALAAIITVIYMFRMYFLTFFGNFRGSTEQEHHLHESPVSMTLPLMVLAILSLVGGWIQLPHLFGGHPFLNDYLRPLVSLPEENTEGLGMREMMILAATVIGLGLVWVFGKRKFTDGNVTESYAGMGKLLQNKYYVDEMYEAAITRPLSALSGLGNRIIDNKIIDGAVYFTGKCVTWAGTTLRYIQTGQTGLYIFLMVVSMVLILALNWLKFIY